LTENIEKSNVMWGAQLDDLGWALRGSSFNPPHKREAVPSGNSVKCRIRDRTFGFCTGN